MDVNIKRGDHHAGNHQNDAERAVCPSAPWTGLLHDRPYVKAEVRQRVLAVMEELDYWPNHMASALATSGTVRRFAMVQPRWEGYVGREIAAGAARFREERRDYNLRVDVEEYAQGDTAACLALLERLAQGGGGRHRPCAPTTRPSGKSWRRCTARASPW